MICKNCSTKFDESKYAYWDERCSSFASVKYTQCPNCGKETIVKYLYDIDYQVVINYNDYDNHLDKYMKHFINLLEKEKE